MIRKISRLLYSLFPSNRGFNSAEKKIISFAAAALPETERDILNSQLAAVSLVQRQNSGRLVAAFYPEPSSSPTLPYHDYEYCLAKISYKSLGKTKITFLVLHNGRLMSLERNVPVKEEEIESLVEVILHPGGFKGAASEIDHEEHSQ